MPSAPTVISIRTEVSSPYKGGTKTWSNRWFLNSSVAMTSATFIALADWLTDRVADMIGTTSTVIAAIGYDAGTEVPTNSKTYSKAGTRALSGSELFATLEVAALLKFTTTQRSIKNHPIYLFKYMHGQILGTAADRELIVSGRRTSLESVGDAIVVGTTVGGTSYKLAGPRGAVAQDCIVPTHFTHRDFPA